MTHLTHPRRHNPTPAPVSAVAKSSSQGGSAGQAEYPKQQEYPKTETPESYAVFDALSDIICITSFDGTLRFLNRAGRDLLGYVDDDAGLVGCLLPTHTTAARELLLNEVIPTALRFGSATCDTALQTVDGRVYPASQTVLVTPSGSGPATTLTIVIRDVSIERLAAARLGESQRLFEMITRSSPDLIYLYDPADERIVWMNRCPHAFLGGAERDARTLSRREMHRLVHPDDRAQFRAAGSRMAVVYGDSDVLSNEVRMATDGGNWRWMHTRASVFSRRETGAPLLLLGVATDITATKKAELQLIAARAEAEHASSVKNDFLARVGTEFRSALQGIIGTVAEVRSNRDRRLTARELEQLDEMIARSTHLLGTVSDLQDYTRIDAGEMPVRQALVDARDLIRESVEAFSEHPQHRHLTVELALPDDAAPILVDPLRLRQALSHLIANALAFTESGQVTIGLLVTGDCHQPVAIDVSDTGHGIADEAQDSVFAPFAPSARTASSSIAVGRGTGLGLALARAMCEMVGCTLTLLRSEAGTGSTFRITLPAPSRAARLAAEFPVE
ncbi:MAG: PAS domain S-box protein [Gemmatimonadaceae bacterium]|nr:PAS domain S-box protein [Gemmatimonadaceae bacterium]